MRIVHVANFYNTHSGGIKTTIHRLGEEYGARGDEFYFIVPGEHSHDRLPFHEVTPYGTKVSLPGITVPFSGGYKVIRSRREILKVINSLTPDRVEFSDRFTTRSVSQQLRAAGVPTFIFAHETLDGLFKRFLKLPRTLSEFLVNLHNKKTVRSTDYIVATTNFAAREFHRIGATNIRTVSLGVALKRFNPEHRSEQLRDELRQGAQYLLVHCGRLSPEKDPQLSIETLWELLNRGYDARLVVVGMGPLYKKLRTLAADLPVDFLGYVVDPLRVGQILASADLVFAPGPYETFCLAALEAMASGTPVLASELSAVGELLLGSEGEIGGFTAAQNPEAFADKAELILADPTLRNQARRIAENFQWSKTVHGLDSLFSRGGERGTGVQSSELMTTSNCQCSEVKSEKDSHNDTSFIGEHNQASVIFEEMVTQK